MPAKTPKVLLVCSPGGHFLQLFSLTTPVWSRFDHEWVSLRAVDTESLLKGERVHWAFGPTNRSIVNLVRNLFLAVGILSMVRPSCIVSTGAGIAVPFLLLGRVMGCRTVYIESFARSRDLSLTGRMVRPFVHDFVVQSPDLAAQFPSAAYFGTIY